MRERPLCGILVGGEGRRLGGVAKGLLPDPATGRPLVVRLWALAEAAGLDCVLIGERPEYRSLGLPTLADRPAGVGPLGGLAALLAAAARRPAALALSCDLPYLGPQLLGRLAAAELDPAVDVLAARRGPDAPWEGLCARYQPRLLPTVEAAIRDGIRSFQRLFGRLRVAALDLSAAEHDQLDDWDAPADLTRARRGPDHA